MDCLLFFFLLVSIIEGAQGQSLFEESRRANPLVIAWFSSNFYFILLQYHQVRTKFLSLYNPGCQNFICKCIVKWSSSICTAQCSHALDKIGHSIINNFDVVVNWLIILFQTLIELLSSMLDSVHSIRYMNLPNHKLWSSSLIHLSSLFALLK